MNTAEILKHVDHTLLKPVATSQINSKFSAAAKFTLSSTTLLVNIICASLILVLTSS